MAEEYRRKCLRQSALRSHIHLLALPAIVRILQAERVEREIGVQLYLQKHALRRFYTVPIHHVLY